MDEFRKVLREKERCQVTVERLKQLDQALAKVYVYRFGEPSELDIAYTMPEVRAD